MRRKNIPSAWPLRRAVSPPAPSASPTVTNGAMAEPGAAFRAQTFPHVDAIYSDALCLTGSREDAADLVVEAYLRAFRKYDGFRRRRVSGHRGRSPGSTGTCMPSSVDRVLVHAGRAETKAGGRR